MALPADVKDEAVALVATYCATKVPSKHDDKIRIEYKVRGNTITIYERRPPWREDFEISSLASDFLREDGAEDLADDLGPFQMTLLHFRRTFVEKLSTIHGSWRVPRNSIAVVRQDATTSSRS